MRKTLVSSACLLLVGCALPKATLVDDETPSSGGSTTGGAAGSGGSVLGGSGGTGGTVTGGTGGTVTGGTGGTVTGGTGGTTSNCGNGAVESGEDCDGGVGTSTCTSVVGKPATGKLSCSAKCGWDTSQCVFCGNGKREDNEVCDGTDFGSHTCKVVASNATGAIGCNAYCQLDTSGCTPKSPNGDLTQYQAGAPWPAFRGGPFHTGRTTVIRGNALQLPPVWTFPASLTTAPAVGADGTIYFGAKDSTAGAWFYALKPDGTLKWKLPVADEVRGTPALAADGSIYAVTLNGTLYSFSYTSSGPSQNWIFVTGFTSKAAPIIGTDGRVIFASGDGKVRAIAKDGSLGWEKKLGDGGDYASSYSVAVAPDGTLWVPEPTWGSYKMYVLDKDGNVLKTIDTPWQGELTPAIAPDGTIHFAGRAFNPDGTKKWAADAWGVWGNTIGADGSVFGGGWSNTGSSSVTKWSASGSVIWTSPAVGPSKVCPALITGDGALFGGGWEDSWIWALGPTGAAVVDQFKAEGNVMDTPSIGPDGTLYVGSSKLYAFKPF